jgi:hypothetical protein
MPNHLLLEGQGLPLYSDQYRLWLRHSYNTEWKFVIDQINLIKRLSARYYTAKNWSII